MGRRERKNVMNARHSMQTSQWFTPPEYVEAAREVMRSIDLDPASCAEANKVVRARTYHSEQEDGLAWLWRGNVFLNPPGGKNAQGSLVRQFWERLILSDGVEQAIWIGYSLEQLQTLQACVATPLSYPMCVPRRRIAFVGAGKSPSHGNYITYIGESMAGRRRFSDIFSRFGQVRL